MILQIEDVAYQVSNQSRGESSNTSAIDYLKMKLNASAAFFANDIPANESDDRAHSLCKNDKNAAIYCPVRWEAMQKWFKVAREVSFYQKETRISHRDALFIEGKAFTFVGCTLP